MTGTNDPQARRPDDELDAEELENVPGGVDATADPNGTSCFDADIKCGWTVPGFESSPEV